MRKHLKLLKHYRGQEERKVYICSCGLTIEAYSLAEAIKKHKHNKE